ncbi:Endonuclease/exonuclease/phosphatase [Zychaea mexicana]|uniref:Endonuclease/exonuclease/phosphatase n=1 Tax=Zychaea mexicana TaxID=64656 RepID=UPI0022FDF3F3|nr:Endonuclease/exonuclease/phosphatase [Zychaea mexicana]KAI9484655.1 Endonuclease/exonuclease/phosphatase [Zychaea mexicana]
MNSNELSVLTLNCWGLKIVSKKRRFRLKAIADAISTAEYDIVTLQEIWMWEDFDYLKQQTQSTLPYAKCFYSGALGSGLAILSRFPIVSTSYFRYSLAGRPLKVLHGDFYVGKGCGSACIEHPDLGVLEVFTTHLHAGYGNSDEYEGHRVSESWELAHLLRASAAQGRHVIATGDFNSIPTSYNYQLLKAHAFMTDSWLEIHQDALTQNEGDGPTHDMVQQLGITCDSPMNTWTKREKLKQQPYSKTLGDRLDYIFYRKSTQLECLRSSVVMTEHIPGTQMSYSDHFGVLSTFAVYSDVPAMTTTTAADMPDTAQLGRPTYTWIEPSMLEQILELFRRDEIATRRTANLLLALFVFLVIAVIAVYATVIALPVSLRINEQGSLITAVVNTLGGLCVVAMAAFATICFIVGFVFGHTEQRALKQFALEVDTLLEGMKQQQHGGARRVPQKNPSPASSSDTEALLRFDQ